MSDFYWVQVEHGAVYCDGEEMWGSRTKGEVIRVAELGGDTYWACRVMGLTVRVGVETKEEACKYVETVVALRGGG